MIKIFGLKMNQGPWGPWAGGNKESDKNSGKKNDQPQSDSNSQSAQKNNSSKKYENFIKDFFGNQNDSNGSGGGSSNNSDENDFFKKLEKTPRKKIGLFFLAIIAFWMTLGFYKVDSDENAIILYFGKFYSIATPGLNYHIPFPFGKVIKQSVTTVNSEEFGSGVKKKKDADNENLMLTGDENIVDIEFQVQWQISDIEKYTFNLAEPRLAIRKASESAMREIIARTPISNALSDGKSKIEQQTKELLQQTLDSYGAGVRVILVQLRRVDPPLQVIDAFRDVQTAKADKERQINEAQAYANDIIPRARGSAAQMSQQAEAFHKQIVADAEGEAERFSSIYNQYKNSKQITRKRIYLETMEKIYRDVDKVIVEKESMKNAVTPYLPINDLNQKKPN